MKSGTMCCQADWYVPNLCASTSILFRSQPLRCSRLRNQLARGQRLRELLKQSQSAPLTVAEQISTIYTETNGYLDSLEIGQVRKFLVELRTYLKTNKPQFQEIISSTKTFTEEAETLLKDAIQDQMECFRLQEQL
ncbi:hypothetical protein PVK06_015725 [Gossypium arboreum]|uniref:ATP synthase alpha subunit C-terminal domain-containing protein n=1 Tax=Gossypium arboreum TaxID=29729 RepID=A0ABR0PY51_GOSAR|nr:hypothetical protein PVK06_015725 [Gossypium arboreum]